MGCEVLGRNLQRGLEINWIDVLLITLIALGTYLGWRRGFIRGMLNLLTWLGSVLFAFVLYSPLSGWLHQLTSLSEVWARPVAFILLIFVLMLSLGWASSRLVKRIPAQTYDMFLDHVLGIIPGFIEGLVNAGIATVVLLTLPLPAALGEPVRNSPIAGYLAVQVEKLSGAVDGVFGEAVSQGLTYFTVPSGSPEWVKLPYKVPDPVTRADLEDEMLNLVNSARTSQGLGPLQLDVALRDMARQHSTDMFVRGYFGHVTPEGLTLFDRLREANVSYLIAGENIALTQTLAIAQEGFMNSPGHRENILRPQFGRVGIGIVNGGKYGLMITQVFSN